MSSELAVTSRGPAGDPASQTGGSDLDKFLELAVKRFNRCQSAESANRQMAVEDLKFKAGDQWPENIKSQRTIDRRPCLTINKMKTFVHQITNDQRQNRPAISVSPVGDKSDIETARMLKGLIRQIERQSNADIAYDTAFDSAVSMGWGYWRIITEYDSDDSFNQNLRVERIRNPFRVYMDPDHQEPDGSDAQWCFISDLITREDFKEQFPNATVTEWQEQGLGDQEMEWDTQTHVRIADYYYYETQKRRLVHLANGHTGYYDELAEEVVAMIDLDPEFIIDERDVNAKAVKWCKITAYEKLEETDWLGESIPVIKVIGDESDVEGKVTYAGLVRDAKDPQRMYNFWPLALNTRIPTPTGWKNLADIHAGDYVFSEQGKPAKVLAETPIFINRNCYRVNFDDGSHIVADAVHPWRVEQRGKRKAATYEWTDETVTTAELKPGKHFIWATDPLELPEADLPIHPYLLGAWLGDGTTAEPQITQGLEDADELRANLIAHGHSLSPNRPTSKGRAVNFTVYGVRKEFSKLGLLGHKHIPAIYLRASKEQRQWLLKGLMDTDGSIGKRNNGCSYTTISDDIAEGFSELLASLGIKAVSCIRHREARMMPGGYISELQPAHQFNFSVGPDDQVFGLQRKNRTARGFHPRRTKRHRIVSVESVASEPVKCITVDTENHLFLAGDSMIPTHNCTSETELIALAPKAPWIIEEGQIEGYEKMWKEANVKSQPFLIYKGTNVAGKPAPPPQRQQFAGPPQGVVNAKIGAAQDMQAVTGIRFDATQQERMYDESGKALRELKRVGDLGNFHYVDNLGRSLRYTGRQFVDLIPKYYDTRRVLTILREDDSEQTVTIDPSQAQPYKQNKTEQGVERIYNPKVGKYEVAITIGPSFATKRAEAADSMLQFMKVVPQSAPFISDLIAKNMDWPGAQEISARLETTLPPAMQEKAMDDLPQEARGIVMSLKQQLEQAQQQLKQSAAMLGDKDADRKLQQDKIDKDFQAKMTDIQTGLQETILKLQGEGQADNEAAMTKVVLDHQVKVQEMLLEFKLEIMKLEQERDLKEQELRAELAVRSAEMDQQREMHEDDMELEASTTAATLEQGERLETAKMESGERVAGEKVKSGERVAGKKANGATKPAAKSESSKLPDIHIHVGGGKKKITKGKDGSYVSEDVSE